ncbi:hypothetical protein B0T14DRAFT_527831 [Immersiella caudata]|uniref:Pentatricopeptide repeat-containing protein n=1 Tax=Immersiella caudata TaxID=314043 RepID=A0AA40BUK5_9PEZI|nr:hypothetical protein B0T14DRAFT_527831 [Immersiella caudata]
MHIAAENKCQLTHIKGQTGGYTLHGQASDAAVAVEQILEHDPRVTVTGVSSRGPVLLHSGVEYLMAWPPNAVVDPERIAANEVRSLEKWTEQTADQYVSFITRFRLPEEALCELEHGDKSRDAVAAEQILELFCDKQAVAVASPDAFKMALAYLNAKTTHEVSEAWKIFRIMRESGVARDADVWNIMLQGAVRMEDMPRVHNYLKQMVKRGIQVTPRTWILILRLIENEEVKRYILNMMDQRGVLEMPGVVAEVASTLAQHDVDRAVALEQSAETFITSQNELYGPRWLSNYSASKILHGFGCYGRLDDMFKFVNFMFASKTVKPTHITLVTIMTHCRILGSLAFAMKFLRLFDGHRIPLDSVSLVELFKLLRDRRRPIMLSALWRYAQLHGVVAFDMKNQGSEYLIAFRPTQQLSEEKAIERARMQTQAARLFRHVEGGFSDEEQRTLLEALFPWPADESPSTNINEDRPGAVHVAVDLILDWLNELDEIVKAETPPLSELLVKAERYDNQLARIKVRAPGILGRRKKKKEQGQRIRKQ